MATKTKTKAKAKALTPKQAAEAAGKAAAAEVVKHMVSGGLAEVMKAAGREIADRVVQEVERREAKATEEARRLEMDGVRHEYADGPVVGLGGGGISTPRRMDPVARGTPALGGNQAEQLRAAAEALVSQSGIVRIQAVEVRARLGVVPSDPPSLAEGGEAYKEEGLIPMVLRVMAEATGELARAERALGDVMVALE